MSRPLHGTPVGAPSYQDYLDRDSRPVPDSLRERSLREVGTAPLDAARYTSPAFAELEAQRMWTRTWQMACREEELPEPGDTVVYDIVGRSLLITRQADGSIRALHNSCTHRGRKLLLADDSVKYFRCPFHGFSWHLDGTVRSIPCRWDFEHVTDAEFRLPEARVGTWGGFVFVNMDPAAMPLDEYLEVLPRHFARWRLEDCWKAVHVAKRIPCNWKVAQEAFMESYHVIATHPQILAVIADANSQYDIYGDHVSRNLAAFAAPSPHLGDGGVEPQQTLDGMLQLMGRKPGALGTITADDARGPRAILGDANRRAFNRTFEGDFADVTDAETLDALVYNVFPNFAPWGGFAPNIVYRWRPDGGNVNSCVMEVMILKRPDRGQPRPKPVPVHWLRDDQPWSDATELPILGPVIDQDMSNMPFVQEGLLASATGRVQLGAYQEIRIRHFHETLDRYLAVAPSTP
ncbi:MAG: aromatic ring-hydroxylating dioxygenase subunit alpha [Gammaproteobacteria bacterium]|nr:aromatic ring-hydroxylating dioxygenase subunit alpha [Gammaproteobacteria bacterium]